MIRLGNGRLPGCNHWKRITIKLSLYDKKRRWRIWVRIFFGIKHYLGDGSFPFHQDAGKSPPRKNAVYWITPDFSAILRFLNFWKIQKPHVLPLFDCEISPLNFGGPNFRGGTFHVLQRFSVLKPGLHRVFTMLNWQFVISGYSHSKLTPHQLPPFSQKRHPRCSQDMWHCSPYVGIHGVAVKKNPLCQFSVRVISKVG